MDLRPPKKQMEHLFRFEAVLDITTWLLALASNFSIIQSFNINKEQKECDDESEC